MTIADGWYWHLENGEAPEVVLVEDGDAYRAGNEVPFALPGSVREQRHIGELHGRLVALQQPTEQEQEFAALYKALRSMHWNDGKLAVVRVKDLGLGVLTFSGERLDEAIRREKP